MRADAAVPYRDLVTGKGGPRIARGLLRLRGALRAAIPAKTVGDSLLLATWNIRDFGRRRRGRRLAPDAIALVAVAWIRLRLLGHGHEMRWEAGTWSYQHSEDADGIDEAQATWAIEAVARAALALELDWPEYVLVRAAPEMPAGPPGADAVPDRGEQAG